MNRHYTSLYTGRTVSFEENIRDIEQMKQLGVNAVRTCHYPQDPIAYELYDYYGIYVYAEADIELNHYFDEEKDPEKRAALEALWYPAMLERQKCNVYNNRNHVVAGQ